jgi:acetyl esterase/lipase
MFKRWCPLAIALFIGLFTNPLRAEDLPGVDRYGDRVLVKKDIPFSKEGLAHQKLDLYLPKGEGPFPVVVCWFGGGFTGGNKSGMAKVCAFLADKGVAAAAPGYYLAEPKQDKPGWPQNVNDAKCAVRFLRANAKMYHIDADRIAGLGHSSGAYLAMMLGFTPGLKELDGAGGSADQSSKLVAVVNIAGVCDRRGGLGTGTQNLLGKGYQDKPDLRKLASPIAHITKETPPVYTLHGDDDKTVLPDSARQLDAALKEAGVEHELQIVPKLGHNPITAETLAPVATWLAKKLTKESGAAPEQIEKLKKLGARIQFDDKNRVIGVNLGERKVTDADLIQLKGLDDLQELDLTRTGITSAGLANLKDLTSLKKLFLTETKVDDAGISHLQGMKALETLGLSGTKIGNPALTRLQALTGLKSVFCISTAVTDAGLEKFQKALPQCRVTH